jgi:hypothetical protein
VNARKAASAQRTRRAARNTPAVESEPQTPTQPQDGGTEPEEPGALRIAGVVDPIEEAECRISGCPREPERLGLCAGHFASRRGDGVKPSTEGDQSWVS